MTAPHWSHDPTDDVAWWNYQAGHELAQEHHAAGVRAELPAFHGQPFRDGYADGWQTAEEPARH